MSEMINHNRRDFLNRFRKTAQEAAAKEAPRTPRIFPRPPHAVDELIFEKLCHGCGMCQASCPNSVIEIQAGKATINLDYNACSLCDECVDTCPTGALHKSIPAHIDLQPSFSESCNLAMQIPCSSCSNACSRSAITMDGGDLPIVNPQLCNGCGECRSACYLGAITLELTI